MTKSHYDWLDKFTRNKEGQVVLWQPPNIPLIAWVVFAVISKIASGNLAELAQFLSTAFLFTWAYLEITEGDSSFRRVLGVLVIAWITVTKIFAV
jgi:hypothetical protein